MVNCFHNCQIVLIEEICEFFAALILSQLCRSNLRINIVRGCQKAKELKSYVSNVLLEILFKEIFHSFLLTYTCLIFKDKPLMKYYNMLNYSRDQLLFQFVTKHLTLSV